ncbi:MAG: hypothetical protein OHK0011_11200 [Turneriella sp.]
MNAAIGGVVAGMAPSSARRSYLDTLTAAVGKNDAIGEIRAKFEDVVSTWRALEDRERKEALSFEVVESAARIVNSLLMEKAALRASNKAERARLNAAYHVDSLATVAGNLIRLKAGRFFSAMGSSSYGLKPIAGIPRRSCSERPADQVAQ